MYISRLQIDNILHDLSKKMVFLVGPRQVGKTSLAKKIGEQFSNTLYLNYDSYEDRTIIKNEQWLDSVDLIIFDELHKMKGWKNYLKGVFDTKAPKLKILVTGSARLETFRQTGDSLAGRFFVHHLLPFSLSELQDTNMSFGIEHLLQRGGFPEPLLADTDTESDRWRSLYADTLVSTDVLNFTNVQNIQALRYVFEILRSKVGSPVSYSSIARDIEVTPTTVKKYIQILHALYIVFLVKPYTYKVTRSILKEPKIYFYDNGLVKDEEGARLENFVAVSLLKHLRMKNDILGQNNTLSYLRTKEGREVDFAIIDSDNKLEKLIEVKNADASVSKNLRYFQERHGVPAEQIVKYVRQDKQIQNISVLQAERYLSRLSV